jgi:hypothetical protein
MDRRSFLRGLGILGVAPAIVHAENIMKIWTPPKDIIISQSIDFMVPRGIPGYYNLSFQLHKDNKWEKHSKVYYYDGKSNTISYPIQFVKSDSVSFAGAQLERTGNPGFVTMPRYEIPPITSNLAVAGYTL